jgi:hypothetical protein
MTHQLKTTTIALLAVMVCVAAWSAPVLASTTSISLNPFGGGTYGNLTDTGLGDSDPVLVAAQLTNVFLRVLGTITVLLMLYGGWVWLWARGNEEDIKKAKDIIRGAIIGLLVILASYGLTQFVFYYLTRITNAV